MTLIYYSAAKQQISWVVSLWWSPLTFVWPGVPNDRWLGLIGAPSDGDWDAIWRYFVSMRLYLAMLLYVSIVFLSKVRSLMTESKQINLRQKLTLCYPMLQDSGTNLMIIVSLEISFHAHNI